MRAVRPDPRSFTFRVVAAYRRGSRQRRRGGAYAILFALTLFVLLAFGALAVDVAYMRVVDSQAQDVADAASQAAMLTYRSSASIDQAKAAAQRIVTLNGVGGEPARMESIQFGVWDAGKGFTESATGVNAVKVLVSRRDADNAVDTILGRVLDRDYFGVAHQATSAQYDLRVILVMDITGSWAGWSNSQVDFARARDAANSFLDVLTTAYGTNDKFGMTVFTGRFAWEFTPLTLLSKEASDHAEKAKWQTLNIVSKAGKPGTYPKNCNVHSASSGKQDNFDDPVGGCAPSMPREYSDEPGTDHTTGMTLARTMFEEDPSPTVYRAQVVLTDGQPNGLPTTWGQIRGKQGYQETRWREYQGPLPHTTTQIENDTQTLAQDMWDDLRVNTWMISFQKDGSWMHNVPKGDGWYTFTTNSADFVPIFTTIAKSLPLAIVE